jgi:alkylation response protein AidB-like acyl-CoA dehydrogenase
MNSTFTEFMGAFLAPDVAAQELTGADGPFRVSNAPNQLHVTRVDGGWQVDGRFPFMTGAADALWCTALGLDANATEAGIYAFVMPMTRLTLTETWVDARPCAAPGRTR